MRHYHTPLRYPGGKQHLAPFIREVLAANGLIGGDYVEPYAGGAGIALELLMDGQVKHIHLNDSSRPIYAFWRAVITQNDELCNLIETTPLNIEEWKRRREILRHHADYDDLEVGFSVLYLNRCNRSGVLTAGVIGGLTQSGVWKMDARFPKTELIRRIRAIGERRDCISVENRDAESFILEYIPRLPERTLVYCDPPYFTQGTRLYLNRYKPDDHARVAGLIQNQLSRKWIVSYDYAAQVLRYYHNRRYFIYQVRYSASRSYLGKEVFIFSDDLQIPSRSSLPEIDAALRQWSQQDDPVPTRAK